MTCLRRHLLLPLFLLCAPAMADWPPAGAPPSATPVRILPLGDSITGEPRAYRLDLYEQLRAVNFANGRWQFVGTQTEQYPADEAGRSLPPDQLHHDGYPGITIGGLADELDRIMRETDPTVVILQIGANDLAAWQSAPVDELVSRYLDVVHRIRQAKPDALLLAGLLTPLSSQRVPPSDRDRMELARQFNEALAAALVKEPGYGQTLLELRHSLGVSDLRDGLHPNGEGYSKFAADVLRQLQRAPRFTEAGAH